MMAAPEIPPQDHAEAVSTSRVSGEPPSPLVVQRTIKVPLVAVEDETWKALRVLAYTCASYGNRLLSESYASAKGLTGFTTYTDAKEELSAAIRDAVGREVVGIWRRLGKKILRGEQTLGRFSADRALVVRDRGVRLAKDDEKLTLTLRLDPMPAPAHRLSVYLPALKKDRYLREILGTLEAEPQRIRKATLVFERPGRKVFCLLSYTKELPQMERRDMPPATLTVLSDGTMRLHGNGRTLTLTDRVYRLVAMKEHFARIHARLRASLGKARRRRANRLALVHAGSFETWAEGPLHQLSSQIVEWCVRNQVGSIIWQIDEGAPALPWHTLQEQVRYKAQECGISQRSPEKAQKQALRKSQVEGEAKSEEKQGPVHQSH